MDPQPQMAPKHRRVLLSERPLNVQPLMPTITDLLLQTARETLDLAARGAPWYASYGILLHYMHEHGRSVLPSELYENQGYARLLQMAFEISAATGFFGWEKHGKPTTEDIAGVEPPWLIEEVDGFVRILHYQLENLV